MLCTGNICRSPMAEGFLRQRLADLGVEGAVSSAGLVTVDQPASAHGIAAMARRGIDIAGHRSRILTDDMVRAAHLVIGMERQHVREAVVLDPAALGRTFTLRELVRRAEAAGPRPPGQSLADWLAAIGAGRVHQDLIGDDAADAVADPIGRPAKEYERTADVIDQLVATLVTHLFPQE